MTDLHRLLADADPVALDPELAPEEALAMRRAVLAEGRVERPAREPWAGFVPVIVAVIVTVAAGVALGRKLPERPAAIGAPVAPVAAPDERRQMQFATPGGTRIIWTLDPQFELRGTTP